MTAAELLRRAADDYRALHEEYATTPESKAIAEAVELVLRTVAEALEEDERELEDAA